MAAHLLEASTDDIVINPEEGTIGVIGVPASSLSWADLATAANEQLPDGVLDNATECKGLEHNWTSIKKTYVPVRNTHICC